MLQVLRDSMKYLAWILWVVIGLFVLFVFVDFGRGTANGPGAAGRAAATVGDDEITYNEFEREYRDIEEQMRQSLGQQWTPELAQQLQLPMQAMNRLVSRKILLAEADRLDLQVSDKELRDYLLTLPMLKDAAGNFVGTEAYQSTVQRMGYSPEQFEQMARQQLLLQRVYDSFRQGVVVSDAEIEERYKKQVEKAKIRYVGVPFDQPLGAAPVTVTDADLNKWYEDHKESYKLPEQRIADYLLIDPRALQASLQIPDAELEAYYQQHQAEYAEAEQVRARHILVTSEEEAATAQRRLAGGEDFATVASQMSSDKGSAVNGGDLGWFGKGRMVPEFEQAAFAAPVGQVVGPVKTQFGFHLIEVQEKKEATTRPFAEMKEAVKARLAAERSATQAEEQAKGLAKELQGAGANARQKMQEKAGQPGIQLGVTEPFGAQGPITPLGMAPQANAAAFALAKGGVSDPLRTPGGWVILHISEIREPKVPALADVRERVRRDAEQNKLREAAFARMTEAKNKLAAGATLESVAAELGVTVEETEEFGHGAVVPGLGYAPELAAEAVSKPQGAVGGPVAAVNKAVVYQVVAHTGFDPAAYAKEKPELKKQLEDEQVNALLGSLINSRKQELGVTYDQRLLQSLGVETPEAGGPAAPKTS